MVSALVMVSLGRQRPSLPSVCAYQERRFFAKRDMITS